MSSPRIGDPMPFRYDLEARYVQYEAAPAPMERLMEEKLEALCREKGVKYNELNPIQRLFLTHYKCASCKLVPVYHLDLKHAKKIRCGKCGHLVSFTNGGKYGKMRKKLAISMLKHGGDGAVS